MRLNVLGPVEVEHDGRPIAIGGPQQRRLLALLLVAGRSAVSVDRMVEVLWPDDDAPDGAARSVLTYVSRLRSALGIPIVTVGNGYRLVRDGTSCDADDFEHLCREAGRALPDRAVVLYEEALGLWRGLPFGEFADEWWALSRSAELVELANIARERHAEALIVLGHHARAVPELEKLVADHPLRERPVAALMQALAGDGRRTEALRAFQDFRARLAEQSGLQPSGELAEIERSILASDDIVPAGTPLRGYVIRRIIGEGAHGRVYEATQPGTERSVAIKAIRPELADSTEFIRRFEAEARLVARLEHPHVVPLYDYWREPGGAYLVFRLLGGGSARDAVVTGGAWSLARVDRLVEEVGGALLSAHASGVSHNDVRSANVLLDEQGTAYLTDFGIADTEGPESGIDGDIRSFAWLIWELLTGAIGHDAWAGSDAVRRRGETPHLASDVTDVPEGLAAVLTRATSSGPGFASLAELILAWRAAMGSPATRSPLARDDAVWLDSARRAAARALVESTSAGINPYRGLEAFDEADGASFFGRDDDIEALVAATSRHRFVTVVGASGSGKSSLVRAGLVPRLRDAGHVVVTTVPGRDPAQRFADAVAHVSASDTPGDDPEARIAGISTAVGLPVLVVVDQFEEVWTVAGPEERDRFLATLATLVDGGSAIVVTTVRADLLDRPLQDPTVGHLVGPGTFVIGPLSPAELDEAIVQPAHRVGVSVDEGLVAELVAEAAARPGSLPMLQFTLTELYERRRDGVIDRTALETLGGLGGAIGVRAERTLHEVGDGALDATRELFLRLVTPGTGTPDTRRRAALGELAAEARAVADRFVSARLLVVDRDDRTREPTIEIAHEALLERWPRLVDWIDADRQWLSVLEGLSATAARWEQTGRDEELFLRGTRLEAAIEAIEVDGRTVTDTERAFVEASRRARDAELRRAQRSAARLRRLLVVTAGALVIALVAGAVAILQRRDADRSAEAAEIAAEEAERERANAEAERVNADAAAADADTSRRAAEASAANAVAAERAARIEALVGRADSIRATQRDVGALLAAEAFRLDDTARTRSALFATFTDTPPLVATYRLERGPGPDGTVSPLSGIVMPDGETAFVLDEEGRVRPLDLATGAEGEPWPESSSTPPGHTAMMRASPDGRALARISWVEQGERSHSVVAIADVAARRWRFEPIVLDSEHLSATFSDDGSTLFLTMWPDSRLIGLDASTGDVLGELGNDGPIEVGGGGLTTVAGGRLLVSQDDGEVLVVDGTTFEVIDRLEVPSGTSFSFRTSDGGSAAIGTGMAGLIRLRIDPLEVVWEHIDNADTCFNIAVFDRAGAILCGDLNGRLVVRDESNGSVSRQLDAQNGNVGTLWPAADERELVTFGSAEPAVTRWRIDGGGAVTRVLDHGWYSDLLSPDASRLVVLPAPADGVPGTDQLFGGRVIDLVTGESLVSTDGYAVGNWLDDDELSVGFPVPDGLGTGVFSVSAGGLARELDDPLPGVPEFFEPATGKVAAAARFRDGGVSTMMVYSIPGGPGATVERPGFWVPASSRDGTRMVIGGDKGLELIDATNGTVIDTYRTTQYLAPWITAADQLFVTSQGGELVQHDPETLEPIRTFGGSRGNIDNVFSSADGSLIVAKGADRFVTLYDTATGIAIGTPMVIPDTDVSNTPSLALDGSVLVYGGGATSGIKVWDLRPERWLQAVCEVAGRNLTRDEWATHIGDLADYRATCPQFPSG